MAQYTVGHLDRLERIEKLRVQLPNLFLAGNGYRGIGARLCALRTGSGGSSPRRAGTPRAPGHRNIKRSVRAIATKRLRRISHLHF